MERKEIKKGRQGRMGFKTKLIIAMLLTALFTQTSSAFGWGKIITLMVGGLQGLVWMVIAMLLLLFVELANAVLIKLLWCTLAMNPTVYGSGFTSQYACVTFGATVPQGVTSMIALFMKILYPMFVVAFVVLATYFIFMAPSPPHRARAKQMLTKIITAMVLTALAPLIYQILIMVAGAMTDGVLEVIDTQILPQNNDGLFKRLLTATMSANPIHFEGSISSQVIEAITSPVKVFAALIALTLMLVFWSIAIMVSLFRYIAVLFLGIIFPLTIAMYMFEFTRNPGRKLLKATIVFIFTPFIMSIWLAVGLSLLKGMTPDTGYFTGLFLMLAMSVLISWSPLQLSGVLNVIGAIVTSIGQFIPHWIGTVLVALGGIMQGKGASAISGAALKFAGGKLTSKLKGGLTKGFAAFRKGGFKELGAAAMGGMRGMGSSMRNLPGMARGALGNIGGSIGRSLSNAATKITAKGALKFGARVVAGKLIEKATFGMASLRGTGSSSSGSGGAGGGKGFEAGKTLKNIQEGLSALRKMGLKGVGKAACVGAGLSLAGVAAGLA
ncbi:MAG: hypothetical protein FJY77_04460, partial [Candidatus Altiarchaeales archaeon]|nr:hypothetical protein [Candidatus Altiarchaeales archaeon]